MARTDRREYINVDVDLPTHEKLAELDDPPDAGWLYVTGSCTAGKGLTDGVISPKATIRKAGVDAVVGKWLVAAGLWHEPGHDCPRCAQPPEGRVIIHDYLQHNRSRAEAEAAREGARRAAQARWGDADRIPAENPPDAERMPNESGEDSATHPQAKAEAEPKISLLTFIGRLARSDARVSERPPAEVIASWQRIAGPDVNLETEAASYLAKKGMRPARDEAAAWVGWLKAAHRRACSVAGIPTIGCPDCLTGWLPDEYGYASPKPCPTCKPRH